MKGFTINDELINSVWQKGTTIPDFDPMQFRQDRCGAWILRDKVGDINSEFGWVIDHIKPLSLFESNEAESLQGDLMNLEPLHWRNNISKGNDYPVFVSAITSNGNKNVSKRSFVEICKDVQQAIEKLVQNKVTTPVSDVRLSYTLSSLPEHDNQLERILCTTQIEHFNYKNQ